MGVSAQEREVGRPLTWWIRHLVFFAAAVALFVWALREWSALLLLDTSRPEACGEEPEHLSRSGAMWFALVGYLAGGGIALLRTEREYLEPQCQVLDRA